MFKNLGLIIFSKLYKSKQKHHRHVGYIKVSNVHTDLNIYI